MRKFQSEPKKNTKPALFYCSFLSKTPVLLNFSLTRPLSAKIYGEPIFYIQHRARLFLKPKGGSFGRMPRTKLATPTHCPPKSGDNRYFIFNITLGYFSSPGDLSFGRMLRTQPSHGFPLFAKNR